MYTGLLCGSNTIDTRVQTGIGNSRCRSWDFNLPYSKTSNLTFDTIFLFYENLGRITIFIVKSWPL